jgi:predicted phage terminase large subunit-like protein
MNDVLTALMADRAKKSLYHFIIDFMPECDPTPFIDGKVVQFLAEFFMYAVRKFLPDDIKKHWMSDKDYSDQLDILRSTNFLDISDLRAKDSTYYNINIPPGHMKSMVLNVLGPTWLFAITATRSDAISHTEELSTEMNLKRQKILNSEKWAKYFPDVYLTKNEGRLLIGNHFGELYSINTSAFTGRSSELIINDDLISAKQARMDKKAMGNAIAFYRDTMPSRIRDIKKGVVMNVQQRLAPGDITGMILNDNNLYDLYTHVALQALSDRGRIIIMPITGQLWELKEGDSLWPERFGDYNLLRITQGSSVFETQYQQNPLSSEDTIVKSTMINLMSPLEAYEILEEPDYIYASHDLAVKATDTSDFVGSVLAKQKGNKLLIIDCLEKKMGYVASKQYIKNLSVVHYGVIHLIEDKANGQQVIQELTGEVPGIVPINPGTSSKTMRLETSTVPMESRNVYFLTDDLGMLNPSLENLTTRLSSFPFVKNDDIVDAFSQLVNYVFVNKTFGMFDKSFTEKNLMSLDQAVMLSKRETYVAITRKGTLFKMIKVHYDFNQDTFYVLEEVVLRTDDSTALRTLIQFAGTSSVVDATKDNHLYNMFSSRLSILNNTDDRPMMEQLTQINSAFSMGKIVVSRNCVELRRDIDQLALDQNALKSGEMKLKGDEGLVSCLRVIIYTVKGSGDFFTF